MRLVSRTARLLTLFARSRRAVAAIELALIFPFLVLLMAGAFEFAREINASRRLTNVVNSMAGMLATNNPGTVSYIDLHYVVDSTMLVFPEVLSDSSAKGISWSKDITISLAGVTFSPTVANCTTGCTYIANIMWTGGAEQRACGAQPTSTSDTAAPSATTLPADLFNGVASPQGGNASPRFAVVADVTYSWTPLVFSKLIGSITMKRSAYITPRYVSQIKYTTASGDDGFGKECPGY
jgi:Flp pilus assembly protein TadG